MTLCHIDHMHFSFSWAGAEQRASYWTHSVGGDELREWGEQWLPTNNTGSGCNTKNHTYRLTVSPSSLSTLTAELPDLSSHDAGSIKVKVARAG